MFSYALRRILWMIPVLMTVGLVTFIVMRTAPGMATDVVSRVFVPGAGVDEDSVTGSAHAVLTPLWAARLAAGLTRDEDEVRRAFRRAAFSSALSRR